MVRISFLLSYGKTGDWLWDSRNLTIWTVAECNIGNVAGNLPCLKPLFRVVLGSTYGRGSRKTTAPQYGIGNRPHGAGTGRQSVDAKVWGTLASNRTTDGDCDLPRSYGAKESFLLTKINADRDFKSSSGSPTTLGEEGERTGESSIESLIRTHANEWYAASRSTLRSTLLKPTVRWILSLKDSTDMTGKIWSNHHRALLTQSMFLGFTRAIVQCERSRQHITTRIQIGHLCKKNQPRLFKV